LRREGRLCGKSADVADMQDVLLRVMQGVSAYAARAAAKGARDAEVDAFTPHAWFTTLTNVNFDAARFTVLIAEALRIRDKARAGQRRRRPGRSTRTSHLEPRHHRQRTCRCRAFRSHPALHGP
jgi:hydroxylamine reductase (hybrid-cluster protein)